MYKEPRCWDEFLCGVKGFLADTEADMRNRGVSTMYCPCFDCNNQKKFAQCENIFTHLIMRGFKKKYTCWNKHGEEGLNEGEAGCLNEGETDRRHQEEAGCLNKGGNDDFGEEEAFPPFFMQPEDMSEEDILGLNSDDVKFRVDNVD
jgi:hypothetical protein